LVESASSSLLQGVFYIIERTIHFCSKILRILFGNAIPATFDGQLKSVSESSTITNLDQIFRFDRLCAPLGCNLYLSWSVRRNPHNQSIEAKTCFTVPEDKEAGMRKNEICVFQAVLGYYLAKAANLSQLIYVVSTCSASASPTSLDTKQQPQDARLFANHNL
jgi:hypothetical protein